MVKTLPLTGEISAFDITKELGRSGTPLGMNDTDARMLAEVQDGEIKYSDFRGKKVPEKYDLELFFDPKPYNERIGFIATGRGGINPNIITIDSTAHLINSLYIRFKSLTTPVAIYAGFNEDFDYKGKYGIAIKVLDTGESYFDEIGISISKLGFYKSVYINKFDDLAQYFIDNKGETKKLEISFVRT